MFKRILVPTDGSEFSETAFDYAIYLANACHHALVCGLSVVDIKTLAGPLLHDLGVSIGLGPFDTYQPKVRKALHERAELALESGRARCEAAGVEYESHLVDGIVGREILHRAEGCDLVVMGKLGEHAEWRSSLLGHTAETVSTACNHPVLVTSRSFEAPSRALFAYDGSSHSYDAMHVAGELASLLKIPLVVVSAYQTSEGAQQRCEAAKRYLSRYELEVDTVPTSEDAETVVLSTAEARGCNLIIMGAYGHSRIRELILGSTTEHVMRKAECPVMVHR